MHIWLSFMWRQITHCAMWQLCEHISSITECEVSCIHFKFTSLMVNHQHWECRDKTGLGQGGIQGGNCKAMVSLSQRIWFVLQTNDNNSTNVGLLHMSLQSSQTIWYSGKGYFCKQNMRYEKPEKLKGFLCSRLLLCPSGWEHTSNLCSGITVWEKFIQLLNGTFRSSLLHLYPLLKSRMFHSLSLHLIQNRYWVCSAPRMIQQWPLLLWA